jgi:hypothetical protein
MGRAFPPALRMSEIYQAQIKTDNVSRARSDGIFQALVHFIAQERMRCRAKKEQEIADPMSLALALPSQGCRIRLHVYALQIE